ncbi:MAG: hypothetical protein AB1Z65_04425, partial [Candidatus Sulfomarinibacteraceae bacterium]
MRRSAIASLVAVALGAAVCLAQDCLEPVGRWPYGVSNDVATDGDRAVLANGAVLQVLDLTTPAAPSVTGELSLPKYLRAVEIDGMRAYAVSGWRLHVMDLSGPDPVESGVLEDISGFELSADGDTVCVLGYMHLWVVDVSNPSAPNVAAEMSWTDGYVSDVRMSSGHAFIAAGERGLRVVDLADPASPVQVAELDLGDGTRADRLDIAGSSVFVEGSTNRGPTLFVVDITDPTQPHLLASEPIAGSDDIVVEGSTACVAESGFTAASIATYDVSVPASPVFLGLTPAPYLPDASTTERLRLAVVDGHCLMTGEFHELTIFNIGNPATPVAAASVPVAGLIEDAVSADGVLVIAAGSRGLRMVDVGDPGQPVELGYLELPNGVSAKAVDVRGDMAYVAVAGADPDNAVVAVDISDPAAPIALGSAPLGVQVDWLTISGDHAYVVDSWTGHAAAIDLTVPSAPVLVASFELGPWHWGWPVVIQDQLIVRSDEDSLEIIDVSNPAAPLPTATIALGGWAGLATMGTRLLAPDWIDGTGGVVRIFDMADPANPVEHPPYVMSALGAEVVGASGSVAYLALGDATPYYQGSFEVVNMTRPQAPALMGLLDYPGGARRLAFGPDDLFVLDWYAGFDTFALCRGPIFADG